MHVYAATLPCLLLSVVLIAFWPGLSLGLVPKG